MSNCLILILINHKERYDKIEYDIHWEVCKYNRLLDCEKWHKHQPEVIREAKWVTILWDFTLRTDRKIKSNSLDIVVKDNKRKTCLLIDIEEPTNNNMLVNEWNKIFQYLEKEIEKMWHLKLPL